ncbi:MAG: site-specific integrase [Prevotella sp.]|nr:site-specific integrase [Prevotella sp.]
MTFNYPQGDDWYLEDKDPQSQNYGRKFHFDFSELNGEEIKDAVKSYVWGNYVTQNMTVNGIHKCFTQFKCFNRYAIKFKITTLKDLTNTQICLFMSYLNTVVSEMTDKKLSYGTRKISLDSVKSIIHWCQIHKPEDVPDSEIFTGNEYSGVNRKLKIDFIPNEVLKQINEALKTEENPYLKYGIIILESTGMRIGDLLNLEKDCIQPHLISGYTIFGFDHKNRKFHKPMPVRYECVEAVQKLLESTEQLRFECDERLKNLLFVHRVLHSEKVGQIMQVQHITFQIWYKSFIKRNNVTDSDGNLYHLTTHQFRRTLGTDMLSKGVNINVIQEVLGHSDPATTKRFYADVKDKDRAEVFAHIGIIGNINQLEKSHFNNETERV